MSPVKPPTELTINYNRFLLATLMLEYNCFNGIGLDEFYEVIPRHWKDFSESAHNKETKSMYDRIEEWIDYRFATRFLECKVCGIAEEQGADEQRHHFGSFTFLGEVDDTGVGGTVEVFKCDKCLGLIKAQVIGGKSQES